jgi:hypothetical protein
MHRKLFIELTPEQQEQFLQGIRERRLESVRKYEETQAKKAAIKDARVRAMVDQQSARLEKELAALEKALHKVEVRVNTIAALCNQTGG